MELMSAFELAAYALFHKHLIHQLPPLFQLGKASIRRRSHTTPQSLLHVMTLAAPKEESLLRQPNAGAYHTDSQLVRKSHCPP